ncbi:MAG: helix-turn-helix transcriptional regulator [Clostridia bacterium]|nr:helix-turn-helix transcriptional regulator [Clostridia bacterium]
MDIGQKLKTARINCDLTQELVAEKIGVSRQTISNWENNKTYPDIVSVIALSDLYSVSLDSLLKEDKKMVEHLEKSTNVVKSRQKLSKLMTVLSYMIIWAVSVIVFWSVSEVDAAVYSILVLWLLLPAVTLVTAALIGKNFESGKKWLWIIFFGVMHMLAAYLSFGLANMVAFNKINDPDFSCLIVGCAFSAVGMAIGHLVQKRKSKTIDENKTDL